MRDMHKTRLVNGINMMSNPYMVHGTLVFMVIIGFIEMSQIIPTLMSVALAYLILSIVGGALAKSVQEKRKTEL